MSGRQAIGLPLAITSGREAARPTAAKLAVCALAWIAESENDRIVLVSLGGALESDRDEVLGGPVTWYILRSRQVLDIAGHSTVGRDESR